MLVSDDVDRCWYLMTFIDVDIRHRIAALRMLYSVTVVYICKVNKRKWLYLGNGESRDTKYYQHLVQFILQNSHIAIACIV